MSPFKEPQPRKKSISEAPEDYPTATEVEQKRRAAMLEAAQRSPLMVIPDYTQFELRKTALEAAVRWYPEATKEGEVIATAAIFEDYLRDGTKPS